MSTPIESKAAYRRWNDMPSEQVKPDLSRRLITGERLMLAHVELKRGCIVPEHAHVHEQMTHVLEGCLRLRVGSDGEAYDLRAGDVIVLPSNVPHAAEALEDTRVVDAFSPPREDWINRTDDYLRR